MAVALPTFLTSQMSLQPSAGLIAGKGREWKQLSGLVPTNLSLRKRTKRVARLLSCTANLQHDLVRFNTSIGWMMLWPRCDVCPGGTNCNRNCSEFTSAGNRSSYPETIPTFIVLGTGRVTQLPALCNPQPLHSEGHPSSALIRNSPNTAQNSELLTPAQRGERFVSPQQIPHVASWYKPLQDGTASLYG